MGCELAPRTLAHCYTVYLLGVVLHVKSKIIMDKREKISIMEKIDKNKLLERKKNVQKLAYQSQVGVNFQMRTHGFKFEKHKMRNIFFTLKTVCSYLKIISCLLSFHKFSNRSCNEKYKTFFCEILKTCLLTSRDKNGKKNDELWWWIVNFLLNQIMFMVCWFTL